MKQVFDLRYGHLPFGYRQKGIWDAELDFLPECISCLRAIFQNRVPVPELLTLARIVETAMSPILE